ncbi:hypothetical protein B0H66DRAFT_539305 [Apodospora peruviana]|uniref:Uncharacterized protein n=1 Tax=Apodospora peruviana TaxID=516989 RepID=A0AAE0IPC8_9PEZI|nr:hypothetical protein B0H66DRAFT_539305 [Apodospora peruviana]
MEVEWQKFHFVDGIDVFLFDGYKFSSHPGLSARYPFTYKRAVDILRDLVESKISVSAAARACIDMFPTEEDGKEDGRGLFGHFLLTMAGQIPYHHHGQAKLVRLIMCLYSSAKFGKISEATLGKGYPTFYSMDQFQISIYENYVPDLDESEDRTPGDPLAYNLNTAAFYARLAQAGFPHMSCYAVAALSDGLEETHDEPQYPQYADDLYVSLASLWISYAGQALYTQLVETRPEDDKAKKHHYKLGKLYKGPQFGLERWTFWKNALQRAGENGKAREQARKLAKRAGDLMEAIERCTQEA